MIKSFRRKVGSNKRGSMLTLVLIVVAMALIFTTSAVMITNSTRARYYDNVYSSEARTVCTAVAESFVKALDIQEITDDQFEKWTTNKDVATVTLDNVPGLGKGGATTKIKFDKDGAYLIATFTTTLGVKSDGKYATENCMVYWGKKPQPDKVDLFQNLIEVGDGGDVGGVNIGAGHDPGPDNTIFLHGHSYLTRTASNSIYSDIITVGPVDFNNTADITGSLIFAGKDASINKMTGNVHAEKVFFVAPDGTQGKTGNLTIDCTIQNACFYNFEINTLFRNVQRFVNGGGNNKFSQTSNNNYATYNQTTNATNVAMKKELEDSIKQRALNAIKEENKFPTVDKASKAFLANLPSADDTNADPSLVAIRQLAEKCISTKSSQTGTKSLNSIKTGGKGVYFVNTETISSWYDVDLSNGPYVIIVKGTLTIKETAGFRFKNGTNDTSKWATFILLPGATLNVGNNESSVGGIQSANVSGGKKDKPHCFIYGYEGTTVNVHNDNKIFEAYCGLFGAGSKFDILGKSTFYGRVTCTDIDTNNGNNSDFPWCPGAFDDTPADDFTPKESKYAAKRFRYFY